jgi:hypothetical protein
MRNLQDRHDAKAFEAATPLVCRQRSTEGARYPCSQIRQNHLIIDGELCGVGDDFSETQAASDGERGVRLGTIPAEAIGRARRAPDRTAKAGQDVLGS